MDTISPRVTADVHSFGPVGAPPSLVSSPTVIDLRDSRIALGPLQLLDDCEPVTMTIESRDNAAHAWVDHLDRTTATVIAAAGALVFAGLWVLHSLPVVGS